MLAAMYEFSINRRRHRSFAAFITYCDKSHTVAEFCFSTFSHLFSLFFLLFYPSLFSPLLFVSLCFLSVFSLVCSVEGIIVCPSSLIGNWVREMKQWLPHTLGRSALFVTSRGGHGPKVRTPSLSLPLSVSFTS